MCHSMPLKALTSPHTPPVLGIFHPELEHQTAKVGVLRHHGRREGRRDEADVAPGGKENKASMPLIGAGARMPGGAEDRRPFS